MHIEQLECLVEVAKMGSLTAAANNLHVTLSAVSQSISNLEAELGIILLRRGRQGAVPTGQGQVIIAKAYEVLSKIQDLKEEVASFSSTQSGELRVGTIPAPLTLYINAIFGFKRDYPQVQLDIVEKGTSEIIEDIRHHRLDVGLIVIHESDERQQHGLEFDRLLQGKMVVCVSRRSPLALFKRLTPEQLQSQPLVLYKDDNLKEYIEAFQSRYGPVDVLFSTNNRDAIMKAVGDNAAITVGLDFSFHRMPANKREDYVILDLDFPQDQAIYLTSVRSVETRLTNLSRLFLQKLKHELEQTD
ncbi:DNA-binding transcriptional LysR family regulator [Paenibacillus phyllosphaerae]|uniref:DNA-binding transcriptional LysR family regulator n=1 Tax=Paenibacillus phyllosphaerae TaxID=274593 RepID=A0A7W5FNJ3_9BACL|nr:LysR family transcriptional regulator [Paenibacillus phyllosphaerae]MBB3111238.1 DNA-binding transcriptional LysR family regulator [Paenibacillus phyllosphaerae]